MLLKLEEKDCYEYNLPQNLYHTTIAYKKQRFGFKRFKLENYHLDKSADENAGNRNILLKSGLILNRPGVAGAVLQTPL